MSLKATDAGIDLSLTYWLNNWVRPYVKLFKNNHTPGSGDAPSDYTEANFAGYSAVLIPSSYSGPVSDGAGRRVVTWSAVTFTATGSSPANDIYGYYVYDFTNDKVLWAERLTSPPFTVNAAGLSVSITPKYTRKSEF